MTTSHTPGPWKHDPEDNSIIGSDEELSIATIDNFDEGGEKGCHFGPTSSANARLISAAPELLDALIAAEQAFVEHGIPLSCHASLLQIRAAIDKATGEAQ